MKSDRNHAEACYHKYIFRIPEKRTIRYLIQPRWQRRIGSIFRSGRPCSGLSHRVVPSSDSGNDGRRMIRSAVVYGRTEFRIRWVRWNSSGYGSGVSFSNRRIGLAAWNPYAAREIKNPPAFEAGGFLGKIDVNDRELPACFFEGKRMLDAPTALHLLRVGPGHDACLARIHIRTRKPPERSGLIGGCGAGGHVR